MAEGIFLLGKTITNPKPDRRMRHDWIAETEWKEGWKFQLRRARWVERNTGVEEAYELAYLDSNRYSTVTFYVDEDGDLNTTAEETLAPALLELAQNLVPSKDPKDDVRFIFTSRGYSGEERIVLNRLVQSGAITLAQIKAALAAQDAEDAAEDAAKKEAKLNEAQKATAGTG
jgi:hypothetical protein